MEMNEEEELDGLILDLRNNPGGLLDEAIHTVDKFVGPGQEVVRTKGRMPETNMVYETREPALFTKPLIVLQNSGSASSSEIVTGALQDLDKAVIIGDRSFGKGLVQIIRPLSYNLAIKITTSKYYTPSGRSIQSLHYAGIERTDSVEVPDSLRTAFKTQAGRRVYEGIGIEPDIEITNGPQSLLEIALLQSSHYFFFANEYASRNKEFTLDETDDQLYNNFLSYLDDAGFDYKSRTERYYAQFAENIDDELKQSAQAQLAHLEELIEAEKQMEMQGKSDEIKKELYLELLSRYEGITGRLKHNLNYDEAVLQGIQLIGDPVKYESILN